MSNLDNSYEEGYKKGYADAKIEELTKIREVRSTYEKYKCPNGMHLIAMLGDMDACIYCFVADYPAGKKVPKGLLG